MDVGRARADDAMNRLIARGSFGHESAPVSPAGVDAAVLATALLRPIGPKHFGFCPL